jgi:hypothetical protein
MLDSMSQLVLLIFWLKSLAPDDRFHRCTYPLWGPTANEANAARKAHERNKRAPETRLRAWACKTRTQKCRRKLSL